MRADHVDGVKAAMKRLDGVLLVLVQRKRIGSPSSVFSGLLHRADRAGKTFNGLYIRRRGPDDLWHVMTSIGKQLTITATRRLCALDNQAIKPVLLFLRDEQKIVHQRNFCKSGAIKRLQE